MNPGAVPRLHAALHWRVQPPFARDAGCWLERAALAGHLAGAQFAGAAARRGFDAEAVFVASTLLDHSVTTSAGAVARFEGAFQARSGRRLHGIVNAYLCAGWGFVLRHAMRNTSLRRLALCIVDLDLHDMQWQLEHPTIGRSGFGMSTLLFELPAGPAAPPQCGGPFANSAFTEFVMALRGHGQAHGVAPTFMPFTQPALHGTAQRVLAGGSLAPNRYDTWGHCFGSDPWIGLIEWLPQAAPQAPTRVLAGAIGFNGYYTLSGIDVAPGLLAEFRCADGARLPAAAADPDALFLPGAATS
jgi:hypothetical protein